MKLKKMIKSLINKSSQQAFQADCVFPHLSVCKKFIVGHYILVNLFKVFI